MAIARVHMLGSKNSVGCPVLAVGIVRRRGLHSSSSSADIAGEAGNGSREEQFAIFTKKKMPVHNMCNHYESVDTDLAEGNSLSK